MFGFGTNGDCEICISALANTTFRAQWGSPGIETGLSIVVTAASHSAGNICCI
jgi:hypothetical protein